MADVDTCTLDTRSPARALTNFPERSWVHIKKNTHRATPPWTSASAPRGARGQVTILAASSWQGNSRALLCPTNCRNLTWCGYVLSRLVCHGVSSAGVRPHEASRPARDPGPATVPATFYYVQYNINILRIVFDDSHGRRGVATGPTGNCRPV